MLILIQAFQAINLIFCDQFFDLGMLIEIKV